MARDVKEVVGVLMRILDGGEIAQSEVADLGFEGDGALHTALNETYVELMEFARDRDLRRNDRALDRTMRRRLQDCLDRIVMLCDREDERAR